MRAADRRRLAVAGVAIAALTVTSGTAALWRASSQMPAGTQRYGELSLSLADSGCVFALVDEQSLEEGLLCEELAEYEATDGDQVVVRFPLETRLAGDNLRAQLRVVEGDGVGEGGIAPVGYRIVDQSLTSTDPSSFEAFKGLSPLDVPGDGDQADLAVDVLIQMSAEGYAYTDPYDPDERPLGEEKRMDWTFVLEQVRP